jgi:diguanylate cyclase (GGDEF)-like protein
LVDHVGTTGDDPARSALGEAGAGLSVIAQLTELALAVDDFAVLAGAAVAAITARPDVAVAGLDAPAGPDGAALADRDDRASALAVPVAGEGTEPVAVLSMHAAAPHIFDADDRAFLHAVANVLTGALRRLAAERGLRHQTLHDPLTQLPNRALLLDRLRLALARRRRAQTWVTLLYLDVDDFKGINDTLGHAAGDEFLRGLGTRLSEVLRPSDTLARLGGDEFAILCEGLDEVTESAAIADRLLSRRPSPVSSCARRRASASR